MTVFAELSLIVALAAGFAVIARFLRQPLIVAYIVAGVVVGPYGLDLLHSVHEIELFSQIGIATLLFIVGLSLNPLVIREVGAVSFVTGVGQVLFTSLVGFGIVRALGFDTVSALYTAVALTFSSTIIILKLLSDRGDLQKLYGKIAVGFLLVQDVIATGILLVVSMLASGNVEGGATAALLALVGEGLLLIVALLVVGRFMLPRVSKFFAASQELLFIFSLAWGLGIAAVFARIGFSVEIGALIAGVALALSPFAYEIGARVKPLRDFFITLFFVLLGSQLVVGNLAALVVPALLLSAFVLIGNPLIVYLLMNALGYKRKTGFMAGLTVAQISEFSLILAALGFQLGHISQEVVSLITLVGVLTIAGSTYLILYADAVYARVEWLLRLLSVRRTTRRERASRKGSRVLIFGYDRVGTDFVHAVQELDKPYEVIDFNPLTIDTLQQEKIPYRYGDAEDVEFLEELDLQDVELIVSTVPDFAANMVLVRTYRRHNPGGIVVVLSHDIRHARELYLAGASYVVMPHYLGAHHAARMIAKHGVDIEAFERERNLHLQKLAKRASA